MTKRLIFSYVFFKFKPKFFSLFIYSIPHRPSKARSGASSGQQYAAAAAAATTSSTTTVASPSGQIWSKAQSTDSLNNEQMSPLSSHYSENIRNSSYFMSSGPQSMVLFNGPTSSGSSACPGGPGPNSGSTGTGSGAQSLPYISRSLSIDAYVSQQQLEMGSKKSINTSNRTSELEEYAKRYEAIGKN